MYKKEVKHNIILEKELLSYIKFKTLKKIQDTEIEIQDMVPEKMSKKILQDSELFGVPSKEPMETLVLLSPVSEAICHQDIWELNSELCYIQTKTDKRNDILFKRTLFVSLHEL